MTTGHESVQRAPPETTSLLELALLFLRLGATAFGGPAAHISMMRDEVVSRRRWITDEHFMDLLGATNLIPGPNSTEMAIHIGWVRRRWSGLLVAGVTFILPAMLLTGLLAWAYVRFGRLPQTAWLLWGIKPVVLAVVVQAIWNLAATAARTWPLRILGLAAMAASALGTNEIVVLLLSGAFAGIQSGREHNRAPLFQVVPWAPVAASQLAVSAVTLPGLFWIFLKIGSVLFGSGYVLLAFLRTNLVEHLHWLTEAQLMDAVAAGQITPGPLFTTATFVGYLLAGATGGLVATAGIFLPAFVFVGLSGPLVPRVRASRKASAFLDGVNVASLALMALVTAALGRTAIVDAPTLLLGLASAVFLMRFKLRSTWLVLGGAAFGVGIHVMGFVH